MSLYGRGKLQYRCRNCKTVFEPVGVPAAMEAMIGILHGEPDWKSYIYNPHNCKNGDIGLADLISVVPDDK